MFLIGQPPMSRLPSLTPTVTVVGASTFEWNVRCPCGLLKAPGGGKIGRENCFRIILAENRKTKTG